MPRLRRVGRVCGLLVAVGLVGCVNLAPQHVRPDAPVASRWPGSAASAPGTDRTGTDRTNAGQTSDRSDADGANVEWRRFVIDPRLRETIGLALSNNRDLRVAALNIERARAQYRIQRAASLPEIGVGAGISRQRNPASTSANGTTSNTTQYGVDLGLAAYEIDFFGRVRNLGEAALQSFFAVEENRRSTQISLVAEVASAWLTMAADTDRLQLARETLQSQQASYDLTRRARELGGASGLTLAQARTTVDTARVDVARYSSFVAQDRNALVLLAGAELPDALLPTPTPADAAPPAASLLVDVPEGLPAEVLQRRPDVLAAERLLRAADADIGAARAALFPRISLTASAGTQSRSLGDLFGSGSFAWGLSPRIDLPIFDAGRRRADVQLTEAQRSISVANYEKTIQIAFREVADALVERETLAEQIAAQQSLTDATRRVYTLSDAVFKNGSSSFLDVLDAQRSMYAAMQQAITLRLTEQNNRVALYRALGGGWDDSVAGSSAP